MASRMASAGPSTDGLSKSPASLLTPYPNTRASIGAPRIQFVGSPGTSNLSIPNEDSRAVDLEDSNLFALNRFPGYDRWEDGSRVTWGAEWSLNVPGFSVRSVVGQSYRLTDKPSLFPQGTGLTDRFSDFVGRTTFR